MTYEDARADMEATPPDAGERLHFTLGLMPLDKSQLEFMLTLGLYDPAHTQIIHDAIKTQEAITRRIKQGRRPDEPPLDRHAHCRLPKLVR